MTRQNLISTCLGQLYMYTMRITLQKTLTYLYRCKKLEPTCLHAAQSLMNPLMCLPIPDPSMRSKPHASHRKRLLHNARQRHLIRRGRHATATRKFPGHHRNNKHRYRRTHHNRREHSSRNILGLHINCIFSTTKSIHHTNIAS